MTTIPRGITRVPNTGHYRVRVKRGDKWFLSGYHAELKDAVAALDALLASLPPPTPNRVPTHPDWKAEQARQKAALPFADLSCIYPSPSGWTVKMTRDQTVCYGGHYATLSAAIKARDTKLDWTPGQKRGRRSKDPSPARKRGRPRKDVPTCLL